VRCCGAVLRWDADAGYSEVQINGTTDGLDDVYDDVYAYAEPDFSSMYEFGTSEQVRLTYLNSNRVFFRNA